MATKIATADGNFTTGATWADVASAASSLLDAENGTTALTTSYVESQTFTPGAVTIDGIAVKVGVRAASPTGTISIRLAQAGVLVAGTEVTINVSDISSRDAEQGWYFFKFAAPVLLVAATLYTVSAKTSSASQVNLYRNATAANWSRMLRTTTTGAPGAGDNWHILAEYTAAATRTTRSVTMDSTATTDYGDNTAANPPQATVGTGGTLIWGVTAATNYILRISGKLYVYHGGTMNMGTTGSPIPRDSSHELQFDNTGTDGDFGLVVFGTYTGQGQSRTSGKNIVQCKLNTDEAAAQTVLGVDTDTGWLSGDDIALAPTARTPSQVETRTLNGNAGATTVTVSVGLTNAHSGTSPTQAEMILLTRNCRIVSVSTTVMAYVLFGGAAAVDCDWVSFRYMGANVTGKRGVEVNTTSAGSCTIDFCSIRDFDNHGIYVTGTSAAGFFIRNTVGYKVGGQGSTFAGIGIYTDITSSNWEVSDCTILSANQSGGSNFRFESLTGVVQRIIGSSCADGIVVDFSALTAGRYIKGTCSNWTAHTNNSPGITLSEVMGGRIDTLVAWRNSSAGILLSNRVANLILHGVTSFGNTPNNLGCAAAAQLTGDVMVRNGVFAGDTSFSTTSGFAFPSAVGGGFGQRMIFDNCTFGVASGIFVAHTTADIDFTANTPRIIQLILRKVLLATSTELTNTSQLTGRSYIGYQDKDQVAGDWQTNYPALGTVAPDASVFHTAAPSEKLTPTLAVAALRLRSQVRRFPCQSGEALAVSVWVRKTAAYAGSTVRLLALMNSPIGITDDTVVDSMTAGADTWEQLTGTLAVASEDGVVELVVECDGAAGSVYVDDWAAAVA